MISLILFVIGVFLTVSPILHLINSFFFASAGLKVFETKAAAGKTVDLNISVKMGIPSIALTIGIVLVYFTAELAKTYILIKLLGV